MNPKQSHVQAALPTRNVLYYVSDPRLSAPHNGEKAAEEENYICHIDHPHSCILSSYYADLIGQAVYVF